MALKQQISPRRSSTPLPVKSHGKLMDVKVYKRCCANAKMATYSASKPHLHRVVSFYMTSLVTAYLTFQAESYQSDVFAVLEL